MCSLKSLLCDLQKYLVALDCHISNTFIAFESSLQFMIALIDIFLCSSFWVCPLLTVDSLSLFWFPEPKLYCFGLLSHLIQLISRQLLLTKKKSLVNPPCIIRPVPDDRKSKVGSRLVSIAEHLADKETNISISSLLVETRLQINAFVPSVFDGNFMKW